MKHSLINLATRLKKDKSVIKPDKLSSMLYDSEIGAKVRVILGDLKLYCVEGGFEYGKPVMLVGQLETVDLKKLQDSVNILCDMISPDRAEVIYYLIKLLEPMGDSFHSIIIKLGDLVDYRPVIMQHKPLAINFIGDIFCDIIAQSNVLPSWDTDTMSKIRMLAGGSCLNSIIHARIYSQLMPESIQLNIHSCVGNDSQGLLCLDALSKYKVPTIDVVVEESIGTGTCIVISGQKDRCFITDRGCIDKMSVEMFCNERLLNCSHGHCSGYYNCSELSKGLPKLFAEVSSCKFQIA